MGDGFGEAFNGPFGGAVDAEAWDAGIGMSDFADLLTQFGQGGSWGMKILEKGDGKRFYPLWPPILVTCWIRPPAGF